MVSVWVVNVRFVFDCVSVKCEGCGVNVNNVCITKWNQCRRVGRLYK